MPPSSSIRSALAPSGKLRAAINLGNPILAYRDEAGNAAGVPKRRGSDAAAFLALFVEEMKAGGLVAAALARHGIEGASVAPAA